MRLKTHSIQGSVLFTYPSIHVGLGILILADKGRLLYLIILHNGLQHKLQQLPRQVQITHDKTSTGVLVSDNTGDSCS
jgi:hypothetical protein